MSTEAIRVLVTGAAGQIGYSLLYSIAKGDVFGKERLVDLVMLDITPMMGVLNGVVMEIQDCAFPNVRNLIPTDSEEVAFKDVQAAFLVGSMPRKAGMERKDLLRMNVNIFKGQGQALEKFARRDVKVLVVGNPANTNAMICAHYAPSIPRQNFSALTRLDQNRALGLLARKLDVPVSNVRNVVIWGNHSSTQFPSLDAAECKTRDSHTFTPVMSLLADDRDWVENTFVKSVQQRGAEVIAARKLSSAMSAAKAACDHMRDWFFGTAPGVIASMAVLSDGKHYGIPADICYSFPVRVDANDKEGGRWHIIEGLLPVDSPFARSKMDETAQELVEEMQEALSFTTSA